MAGRDRRRRRTALFVSLLIHSALFSALLLVAPQLNTPPPTPNRATMVLGLVPEADLGIATHLVSPGQSATRQPAHAPPSPQQALRSHPAPAPAATALPAAETHPPLKATTAAPSGPSGAPSALAGAGDQAAGRRALAAALACAAGNAQNLDEETRATCRKRLSEAAAAIGDARVDTIPPLKRAYYDAVQKAYQDIRHAPTPDTQLTHLPGAAGMYDQRQASIHGRPPYAGCGLKFGGPKGAAPAGAPPHSLFFKLGPVVCGVVPPQGVLTEESATPNADDVP